MRHVLFALTALLTFSLSNLQLVQADERIRSAAQLLSEGYRPVARVSPRTQDPAIPDPHSITWPVRFQDSTHSIGNSMAEFQPFGDPYFHGGCDLRVRAGADIHAPVDGKLEAGFYSYTTNADGSMDKYWKPWPQSGDPTYFEVAVVADDGIRYEFHHINSETLPQTIVDILNHGGGRVSTGTVLGHVITWPDGDYHHTHYNVVLPSGTRINPEYVSPLLPDHKAPEIQGVYAVTARGDVTVAVNGSTITGPEQEIVVAVVDHQDGNIYDHPPVFMQLKFASGESTTWDFRQTLSAPSGTFPPLWDVFKERLDTPSGEVVTDGGYGTGQSLIRLKIPPQAKGAFSVDIADIAGNHSFVNGTLKASP